MSGMAEHTILLIEKESSRAPTFAAALQRKGYAVHVAPTGTAALHSACTPALVILNAASLGSSGVRICRSLRQKVAAPIIHILVGQPRIPSAGEPSADIHLMLPFTPRKLINCIKRLMPIAPRDLIAAGPIAFAPEARVVQAHGRETRLTPRTASLLQVFLSHPGETLDRGYLMRQVWKTDYVGDTRTLDVHVRWVREAIEVEPASPRHLLTQRGVGYRFVPEPDSLKPGT
jgi:DNA-binding response OmpR family regulator